MTNKPRFEASPDVETCVACLRKHNNTDIITYSALSSATGRDIGGRDRHILQSARKRLERESIVFVVETGKGVRRATDSQIATLSTEVPIDKTRRIGKTAKKRQRAVNVQNLSQEQRATFYVGRAILGTIEQATRKAFRTRLRPAVNASDGPLPIKQTLEMFKNLRQSGQAKQ
jgi:hypothetical protein